MFLNELVNVDTVVLEEIGEEQIEKSVSLIDFVCQMRLGKMLLSRSCAR